MTGKGDVVWAPDPFGSESEDRNPRPWLVISTETLPYPDEESIAVALTTQSHHTGSVCVPNEAWKTGNPDRTSHVLPWTVATLKHDLHVVGKQGRLDDGFVETVANETVSYLSG